MKKTTSVLLAGILSASVAAPAFATSTPTPNLKDIGNSYAKTEIQALVDSKILSGYGNDTFMPSHNMTRDEFATALAKALNLSPNADAAVKFTDVEGWAKPYVGALVKAGITSGVSETQFGAEQPVSREQLAVFIVRALGDESLAKQLDLTSTFTDENDVNDYAKPYVAIAQKIGFIKGSDNGDGSFSFQPQSNSERQAVARLVYELFKNGTEFKSQANSLQNAIDVLTKSFNTMNTASSYSVQIDEQATLDGSQVSEKDNVDYTKSPLAIHEKNSLTAGTATKTVETYVQNGTEYTQDANGQWKSGPFNGKLQLVDQPNYETLKHLINNLTVSSNNGTYTITGSLEPKEFQKTFDSEENAKSPFSQVQFSVNIDETTYLEQSANFKVQLKDGSNESTNVTFTQYNSVQPIQVPQSVLDTVQSK